MSDDVNEKLLAAKMRWAKAARNITGTTDPERLDRLPPGQRLVANWPVLDLGVQPDVTAADWKLAVDGLVENPVSLSLAQLLALPQTANVSDIHCVTKWSRYDNHWVGVSARDLMALVRPKAEAGHVILHAYDGYTTNVALEAFASDDAIIAHTWEGYPITRQHGGPVRIVIPRYYFWKSAKWVKRIEFSRDDKPGFWETRGYHNLGDPWLEERYS
ncbi:MAG: sulfite oxidase-like oxidoreductase [Alphaproteobacteria bacterium]|nr:sulfite oxidase-like oxidoreductase [Alphaproteobacteria bacterium]